MFQETMDSEPKRTWVAGPVIIGAGPSGLAVAACLKERGVPYLILEKESCIASLWRLRTYDTLQLHLSKKFCQLPYRQFPPEFPLYPSRRQFIAYLDAYANHFAIEPMFSQKVASASYDPVMGFWRVRTKEFEFICRWIVVATGENSEPVVPEISGITEFGGRILHSSMYKNGNEFTGRKVLVIGCGNSGMEVSLDLCHKAAQVSLVVRDKVHILPREILGISTFALSAWLKNWFSIRSIDHFLLFCSRLFLGDTNQAGIRRPEMGPIELKNLMGKTPVLDTGAFARIKSGEIKVVRGVRRLTSNGAEFLDSKVEEFDAVIFATGYASNVTSWLKEGYFSLKERYNWKGENGIYRVGFAMKGLLGTSIDAQKVAEDVARQWNSETMHLHIES